MRFGFRLFAVACGEEGVKTFVRSLDRAAHAFRIYGSHDPTRLCHIMVAGSLYCLSLV